MAQMAPDIYDLPLLHRDMLSVLGIKNAAKLVPLPDDLKPRDPVTENMEIIKGEPVKAFFHQDQDAHIKVHMAIQQDPTLMQLIGQNPKAPMIAAAMAAHIAEHVGFKYRQQIEQQLGMALPAQDEKLPPEVEVPLSSMMAQAAAQVLQASQAQAAQQQAQQQQQDPVVQMQQQDLQIKQGELQLKQQELQLKSQMQQQAAQLEEKKFLASTVAKADQMELDRTKVSGQMELAGTKIGAQIQQSKAKQASTEQLAGVQMGIDVAKQKAEMLRNTTK
jgi:hypothetical protein